MSAYNAESTIASSVQSILNQTYENFEFIVIDDGSTDKTYEILLSFSDERILLFRQNNIGLTKSLNRGLKLATGELIARQDADDFSVPKRFAIQHDRFVNEPNLVLLGAVSIDKYEDGTTSLWKHKSDHKIRRDIFLATPFPHSSVMMRQSALAIAGHYDEKMKTSQDMEFWMRLSKAGKISMIKKPLIERFVHKNSISKKKKFQQLFDSTNARIKHRTLSIVYVLIFSVLTFTINLPPIQSIYLYLSKHRRQSRNPSNKH